MVMRRSALGRQVDMTALAAKNERTRAVGNMSVNARGDTVDSFGRIIEPVTEKVNKQYSKTVGNKSANVIKRPQKQAPAKASTKEVQPKIEPKIEEPLSKEEIELEHNMEEDIFVEQIKSKEKDKK